MGRAAYVERSDTHAVGLAEGVFHRRQTGTNQVVIARSSGMKVLFIYQNFPGQFRHIAARLAKQLGVQVLAIGREQATGLPGIRLLRYKPHSRASRHTRSYARSFEDGVLHGQPVLRLLLDLEAKGYRPDVLGAHPGWGETLRLLECRWLCP
jgi:hypothetical protein